MDPSEASMVEELIAEHPDIKDIIASNMGLVMIVPHLLKSNIPKSDVYDSIVVLKDHKDIHNPPPDDLQAKLPASVRALLKKIADEQESHGQFSHHYESAYGMNRSNSGMGGDVGTIVNNALSPMQNGIIAIQSSLLNIEGNIQTILSQIAAASGGPATEPEPTGTINNANSGGGRRTTKRRKQKRKSSKRSYRRH